MVTETGGVLSQGLEGKTRLCFPAPVDYMATETKPRLES
jgi:hypothetical protein